MAASKRSDGRVDPATLLDLVGKRIDRLCEEVAAIKQRLITCEGKLREADVEAVLLRAARKRERRP